MSPAGFCDLACRRFVTALVGCLVLAAAAAPAAEQSDYRHLDADARMRIDAMPRHDEPPAAPRFLLPSREDLAGWLLTRTPLPREAELRFAAAVDEQVRTQSRLLPTSELADKVLEKLVAELPARMRPEEAPFRLQFLEGDVEPAFTTGGGRLYVHRDLYDALVRDPRGAEERLAFVMGRLLGHVVRGHVQARFQLMWLEEELAHTLARPAEVAWIRQELEQRLQRAGNLVEFRYDDAEVRSADLFSLHLCRNAGYDVESVLDVVRADAQAEAVSLADPKQSAEPADDAARTHARRLRSLRRELDGSMRSENYGLFEFDRGTADVRPAPENSLSSDEDVVICVHGMASGLRVYRSLVQEMARRRAFSRTRILGFQYPSGESLAGVARFLESEIKRVSKEEDGLGARVDFVGHSAGGLVVRYYAEVLGNPLRRAVLQGTPHAGSNLAALKPLLDARQFCAQFDLGNNNRASRAIRDVQGQIGFDVQSDSLFLRYLNRHHQPEHSEKYVIHRGQALSGRAALVCLAGSALLRRTLLSELKDSARETPLSRAARTWVAGLRLPAEIIAGDLAVSLASAELDDVPSVTTYRVNHAELPRAPATIAHVVNVLSARRERPVAEVLQSSASAVDSQ